MSSKIQTELSEATGVSIKRGQDRQAFIIALMVAVSELSDKAWDGLSAAAQDWYNEAADAKNAKKKEMPDFPDLEEEKEEAAPRRRKAAEAEDEPAKEEKKAERAAKVGDVVTVKTTRGKVTTGKVVEIDSKGLVLDVEGEEIEYSRDRIELITLAGADETDDEDGAPDFKEGDEVTLTNARGKVVTGKLVELTDEIVVIDDGKEEHEFTRDRVKSIVPVGGKKAAKAEAEDEPAKAGRRKSAKDEEPAKEEKTKRSSNSGVSVGTRIMELIAEDLEITEAEIGKALKKEGLEFKENTLSLNFTSASKFLEILKAAKRIKG